MHKLESPINALVMLFALTLPAWSQTQRYAVPAASVADDSAAYGRALESAADSALANVMREAAAGSQIVEARTNTTRPPDANVLHQFAELGNEKLRKFLRTRKRGHNRLAAQYWGPHVQR
jgi:hypothetical protein